MQLALDGAEQAGARTHLADLRDPLCDGSQEQGDVGDVARLREEIQQAEGIVLGTPENHGGYSGVLKNCLDLMGFDEFEGKLIGLVGVSGGRMGGFGPMNALREVGRALHVWVVPTQAAIPKAGSVYDDETADIDDADLEERVRQVGEEVVRYARLHDAEDKLTFLREWEVAAENPGGEGR